MTQIHSKNKKKTPRARQHAQRTLMLGHLGLARHGVNQRVEGCAIEELGTHGWQAVVVQSIQIRTAP